MEVIFLMVLPAMLWAQSWYFLDLYRNAKTLGVISAAVAVTLGSVVAFGGTGYFTFGEPADTGAVVGAFVALWAIYAAVAAGVYLWGFDERTLGLYSLFIAVISILYMVYFLVGGEILGGAQAGALLHWPMAIVAVGLAVSSLFTFFHLAPPFNKLRYVTGWITLVVAIMIMVMSGLVVLGVNFN